MTKPFATTLKEHNLELKRASTSTLQINVGYRCNLACKHCHVHGGPSRTEVMQRDTMDEVIAFAGRNKFELADITGGAPELVPDLVYLLDGLSPLVNHLMLRSNLTMLFEPDHSTLLETLQRHRVAIVASFPSANERQMDSQRGRGVHHSCIDNLKKLNEIGYGRDGSDLELHLVANPTGAFMPMDQCRAEKKFKTDLARKWGIEFTSLFTFANVPLGRFKEWLEKTGNTDQYMGKLCGGFNPDTVSNLMCKTLISVSWNGYLYDCDFNQAAGLHLGSKPTHIRDIDSLPEGIPIVTDTHCYGCTAGAGFT